MLFALIAVVIGIFAVAIVLLGILFKKEQEPHPDRSVEINEVREQIERTQVLVQSAFDAGLASEYEQELDFLHYKLQWLQENSSVTT